MSTTTTATFPIGEEVKSFRFPGKPGLFRRVTATQADHYDGAFQGVYGRTRESLGWFVPLDSKTPPPPPPPPPPQPPA
jgi:hypothetical protein